jgi:MYXO-CTERM domain-containing protein
MLTTITLSAVAWAAPHHAEDYPSLGAINSGSIVYVDTDALTMTIGPSVLTGTLATDGVAVFSFDSFRASSLSALGSRPLAVLSRTDLQFDGGVSVGAGGFAGATAAGNGSGPGAGRAGSGGDSGAGGGAARGDGGNGGDGGVGGVAYVDVSAALQGGSGGARSTDSGGNSGAGGAGGGSLELGAARNLIFAPTAVVVAEGSPGADSTNDGGGGGGGGSLLLHGRVTTTCASTVDLELGGGDGGDGNDDGGGGGGGGHVTMIGFIGCFPRYYGGNGGVGTDADGLDGDNGGFTLFSGDADGDGEDSMTDCNDSDPDTYTGAFEVPGDGRDQDCDYAERCYTDTDGDGFRNGDPALATPPGDFDCDDPGEFPETADADCDDGSVDTFPGATEVPGDGIDQDCDGGDLCYVDTDGDGARTNATRLSTDLDCDDALEAPASAPMDCVDSDPSRYPGAPELTGDGVDQDCDGGDTCFADGDGDGAAGPGVVGSADLDCADAGEGPTNTDCDDADAARFPGATELVGDEVDQDCDGQETCFEDADADGARSSGTTLSADVDCDDASEAAASDPADCDDADAATHPGALEVVGAGGDQDCTGTELCFADVDLDGFRSDTDTVVSLDEDCADAAELVATVLVDCDDADAAVNPGAVEVTCNGSDEDCTVVTPDDPDADSDGFGACVDCDDADDLVYPGSPEVCDGVDQDCDSTFDEGLPTTTWYLDGDADGYGDAAFPTTDCLGPRDGAVDNDEDCDDADDTINPDGVEVRCSGVDEDCDEVSTPDAIDDDLDGWSACDDIDCNDTSATTYPGAPESCDGLDTNCDGAFDDVDLDGDGATICGGDCDDGDATVPAPAEVECNGADDDCDPTTVDAADQDEDGWSTCDGDDCDDDDAAVNPDAVERTCNGVDDDCDPTTPDEVDRDGDEALCDDCDDDDPDVFPGADDPTCDDVDEDCDPETPTDCGDPTGETAVDTAAPPPDTKDDGGGCGCSTGSGAGWLPALALLATLRRRRR